jgi:hypothetical protein
VKEEQHAAEIETTLFSDLNETKQFRSVGDKVLLFMYYREKKSEHEIKTLPFINSFSALATAPG